jgi:hypothetical protein
LVLLVRGFTTPNSLAIRLRVSETIVRQTLESLMEMGLIKKTAAGYEATSTWVRLPKSSPFIKQHHSNVRLRATESIHEHRKDELHYSGFLTFSNSDFLVIQELLMKTLEETQRVVTQSNAEDIFGICIDAFKF